MNNRAKLVLLLLLLVTLAASLSCAVTGSTTIKLEGVSLGSINVAGKPVSGLPSDKINLVLRVTQPEIDVKYSADGATLIIGEGASLELKDGGISIQGLKPEQVKIEWVTPETK